MGKLASNYPETILLLKVMIKRAQYKNLSIVNTEMILMCLYFGKGISEKLKSGQGESIVDNLWKDLQAEYNGVKGFSTKN